MQSDQKKPKIDASAGVASPLGVMISAQDRETMAMVREAMSRDFGWHKSEAKYRDLYARAIASPRWRR